MSKASRARKGLGKGLGAIFGADGDAEAIREIPVDQIRPNPHQPRRIFAPAALEELAQSIRSHGIVQPLIVVADADGYTLVAGERRWRAARLAGLDRVPAIVRELDAAGMTELALIENLQREDLTPIEEAHAFRVLQDEFGLTQEAIAQRVGKSRSQVANTLRLLALDPEVQALVDAGRLSVGHAKLLLTLASSEQQRRFARLAVDNEWTVRQLADRLTAATSGSRRRRKGPRTKAAADTADPHWQAAAEALQRALGTRVDIVTAGDGQRGRIVLEFYSREDFERLFERLIVRPGIDPSGKPPVGPGMV